MLSALQSRPFRNLVLVALAASPAAAQAGYPDPGFGGGDGVLSEQLSPSVSGDVAYAVVVQPDGKIVTAGRAVTYTPSTSWPSSFAIARHHADGTLDTGFGSGGSVTAFTGYNVFCFDVRLDPAGRIVAAGRVYDSGSWDVGVLRLSSSGALDGTFGTGGLVRIALAANALDYATALALQSDGKIVVAGIVSKPSGQHVAVARLLANGSLDKSFGSKGVSVLGSLGDGGFVARRALAVQPDGRILVGGRTGSATPWAVLRLLGNGNLDGSFGSGGVVQTSLGTSCGLSGLALQPDGRIVAVGSFQVAPAPSSTYLAAARYLPGGNPDPAFGSSGVAMLGLSCAPGECVVQTDGRIVVGLTIGSLPDDTHMALFRLLGSGAPDSGFGSYGLATPTDPGGAAQREYGNAVAIDPVTGHLVVAGESNDAPFDTGARRFALARWLGN